MRKKLVILILIILFGISYSQNIKDLDIIIEKGELFEAEKAVKHKLINNDSLSQQEIRYLKKQLNRIKNIKENYPYTYDDMFNRLKTDIPDLTKKEILKWEKNKTLEYRIINGQKKYFWAFPFNLFVLNKEAENRRIKKNRSGNNPKKYNSIMHKKTVITEGKKSKTPFVVPKKITVCFTFFEDISEIPEGETIRGWLPIPREILKQKNIKIIKVEPKNYLISNKNNYLNASVYVEKQVSRNNEETSYWRNYFYHPPLKWIKPLSSPEKLINRDVMVFQIIFKYTAYAYYRNINPQSISAYDTCSFVYKNYTREESPHIKFTKYLSKLSNEIIGNETNNYLKAKKIYNWICKNITWTNPDYDSPGCLSDYIARARRGDCGSKALLFTTLCRLNKIPARLQGGWMTRPDRLHSQHGWAQMYIEPYGWLTVDPDAGSHLIDSDDEKLKYFHFGNCDSYRLIIYDDNVPLFPLKIFGCSSDGSVTGGLQLGAFEWSGGELESNVKIDTYVEN